MDLYRIYAECDSEYKLEFNEIICTKEALEDFIAKVVAGIDSDEIFPQENWKGKREDVKIELKKNRIKFGGWDDIFLCWEKYEPKVDVVTSFGELYELAFHAGGYEDTYLMVEIEENPEDGE